MIADFANIAFSELLKCEIFFHFFENRVIQDKVRNIDEFRNLIAEFKKEYNEEINNNKSLKLSLAVALEQANKLEAENSLNPLSLINDSLGIKDSWVIEFLKEFEKCKNGNYTLEKVPSQVYKTYDSAYKVIEVDTAKLWLLFETYKKYNHPIVNFLITNILLNSKDFEQGLPMLIDSIHTVGGCPNYYWNNTYGIEGSAWLLHELILLLEKDIDNPKLSVEKHKILYLFFLFSSRFIYMNKSNIRTIDLYAARGYIIKQYNITFDRLFINPDIHYISDLYLSYKVASKHGLGHINPYLQHKWDSIKMYEHGSLIPNDSGGYKFIEELTLEELVKKAEIRSIVFANEIFGKFKKHELNLTNENLRNIFVFLKDKLGLKD